MIPLLLHHSSLLSLSLSLSLSLTLSFSLSIYLSFITHSLLYPSLSSALSILTGTAKDPLFKMPDIGKDLTLMLQKLMVGVSPPLADWSDLLKSSSILKTPVPADPLKPDEKPKSTVDFNNLPKEVADGKFFRLIGNTAKGRPLQYIAFVDNKGTGTQAAVWADVQEKMVSVSLAKSILPLPFQQ
jgi:hypothetical protein